MTTVIENLAGDGTVLANSVLLDEREHGNDGRLRSPLQWDSVAAASETHMGLTKEKTSLDNLALRLLDDPISDSGSCR